MINKFLDSKRNIYKQNTLSEIKDNEREIYPQDVEKKDNLEKLIKVALSKEFHVLFQKLVYNDEDQEQVDRYIRKYIKDNKYFFKDSKDYYTFVSQIVNEIFGLGVLEQYIADKTITEIWILGAKNIYYEQYGKRWESPLKFKNDTVVLSMVNKILAPINRKADESNPIVDARLQDGSRVAITLPPIALNGPEITIRKFKEERFGLDKYLELNLITEPMKEFLENSVRWGANILIAGGTGSGKTTLLNALSSEIPRDVEKKEYEHVITIEDSAELIIDNPFIQSWETRNKNSEGVGEISPSKLVKHSLRNSPDRIILGEIRDEVAYDVLQAAMTGHKGTMSTIHANNAPTATERFATLAGTAGVISPQEAKEMFASSFDLIIVVEKLEFPKPEGGTVVKRLITQISHIVGYGEKGAEKTATSKINDSSIEDKVYLTDIFKFDKKNNCFITTGYVPKDLIIKAEHENVPYKPSIFTKNRGRCLNE